MRNSLSLLFVLFFYINSSSQSVQSQSVFDCFQIDIEVLNEPFCQGSFNGGQLKANVIGGSGFYTYEWTDSNGNSPAGGPQQNATTLSFLTVGQTYWVYVTDTIQDCLDSASYIFNEYACQEDTARIDIDSPFDPNPIGYFESAQCSIKLTNLGCQLKFKPEFIISHPTEDIQLDDFKIEFLNASSNWENIPYTITNDGNAIGYWGSQSGETANCDYVQIRPVKVTFSQFNPTAPTGEYTAILRLWSVDDNGELLEIVSNETQISLTLEDTICDLGLVIAGIPASCPGVYDGEILLLPDFVGVDTSTGVTDHFEYSFMGSAYSLGTNSHDSLTNGLYYSSMRDSNNCEYSDTIYLGPLPVLPDTLWFSSILPTSAEMFWEVNSLADGYKFRYREVGQAVWQGPIASGSYTNGIAEMLPSKTITDLSPETTYEVQVKSFSLSGCEEGWSESYEFITPIRVYVYNVDNTCPGVNTGQVEFQIISDNNYTFLWEGPNGFTSTDTSIYQLAEGDYNLKITSGQSIVFDSTFTILTADTHIDLSVNDDPTRIIYSQQEQLYFAQTCDIGSYLTPEDGFTNYVWNDGDSMFYFEGQNFLIDTSNIFVQVEALDSNNCPSISDSVHISIIADFVNLMEANSNQDYIQSTYVICSTDSSIKIDISPFITDNYSLEWREVMGQNTVFISDSSVIEILATQTTNYQLNISSCTFDFLVNYFPSLPLSLESTNVLCRGDTNARIIILTDTASTSVKTYTVFDSMGQTIHYNQSSLSTDTVENLSAGNYTVQLEDEFLCVVQQEVEILQPDSNYFDSLQVQHIKCEGQFGSLSFKASGGVAPDICVLSTDTIDVVQNQDGYYVLDSLISFSYLLEIVDENGCFHSLNFDINETQALSLLLNDFIDTIACYGDSNAFIDVLAIGGAPDYSYELFVDDTLYSQQSDALFSDLTEGDYEVFVTDQNGCRDSLEHIIVQNPELILSEDLDMHQNVLCHGDQSGAFTIIIEGGNFGIDDPSFTKTYDTLFANYYTPIVSDDFGCIAFLDSIHISEPAELVFSVDSILDIDCQNPFGYAAISIQDGQPPYSYSLNGGDTIPLVLVDGVLVFDNLNSGDYNLAIIDSNSCVDTIFFSIDDLSDFSLTIADISDTLACFGDASGFVDIGTDVAGNYLYSLYYGGVLVVSEQDTSYFGNLQAGQYAISVKDDLGCTDSLLFEIFENSVLFLTENLQLHQDVLCDGSGLGSVTTVISGGVSPYTIGLLNQEAFDYPHQFNDLYVGFYDFIATDTMGCTAELTVEIKTNPISPELFLISNNPVNCENLGSVEIELVNGGFPFIFNLDGSNISVTLDNNNRFILSELEEGNHQLLIVDDYLCRDSLAFEIDDVRDIDFEIINSLDTLDCYMDSTGFVEFGILSGTAPFTFDLVKDGDTIATQSSSLFDNLVIGNYLAVITDATSCTQQLEFSIVTHEVVISDSIALHKDVSCFGLSDGEFMLSIESIYSSHLIRFIDSVNTLYPWQNHPHLFTNLSAGVYQTEIVTSLIDDCPYYFEVEIFEPDTFVLDSFLVRDVACYGDSSGLFDAYISGGAPQYTYLFNNNPSLVFNALPEGAYSVNISDSNNCTIDTNFVVSQNDELNISLVDSLILNVSCFGNNNGQIGVEAYGGLPPYQFKINNGAAQDSNVFDELVAEKYLISVLDSLGCEDTLTITITQPDLNLFIDAYQLSDTLGYCTLCYGDSSGFIDITLTGGTPAYDFFIVNHPDTFTTPHIEKLVGGQDYEIFAIDAEGCPTDTIEVECTSPEELILSLDTVTLPNCCYSCDAEIYLRASGGLSPYSYGHENQPFQSDSLFTQLCGDEAYSFKILDSYGCEKIDSSLAVPNRECLTVDTVNFVDVDSAALIHYDICRLNGTAKIYTTAKEGVGDYSFSIDGQNFIQSNEILFDSLTQGAHYIIVKDELGCVDTLNFNVLDADPIVISELTVDTIFCGAPTINSNSGQSEIGYINAVASGGSSDVYFYSLDPDSALYSAEGEFAALDSGWYSMNIKDLNDCVQEFDIYIPHYSASVDYTISDVSCAGFMDGIVHINSINGGINPWVSLNGNNSNPFTSLQPGNYDLSVYYYHPDSIELCSYTESIEIKDREALAFSYQTTNTSCNGTCDGIISIDSASGGLLPHNFICLNTNDSTMNYSALCADEYAVKMLDSNGCFIIKNIVIYEPNSIYPIIDYVDGDLVILEPTLNNPLSGTPPYSYQWYDSNGEIVGANSSVFDPSLPGMYSVVVTDSNDCVGESSNYSIEVLGLNNWHNEQVDVFPNPFNQKINVKTHSDEFVDWMINDMRGRVVLSGINHRSWSVNTSNLLNGVYFLKINNDGNELIYKIIKQ